MSNRTMSNENIVQLSPEKIKYATIEQAIEDLKNGKFVIVADDEGRENEGDLVCAAEKITPEMMNFMLTHARGMVCVALTNDRAADLNLHPMVAENTDPHNTAYTISVDAGFEFGVTTGVSVNDRVTTIQRLATTNATALDFRRPGHTFPITAKAGGVFRRIGHTEAVTDLTRLAGLSPIGVMSEILNEDGSMARRDDLAGFAKKHGLSFVTITQLIQYRLQHERSVTRRVSTEIETRFGTFTAIGYKDALDGCEHLALVKGPVENLAESIPYVRVQHEDVITDLLGKADEEISHEIAQSMKIIQENESGVLVYLRHQDDSVHGVLGALKNYHKPDVVAPTNYNANKGDLREYGAGAQILADLGVKKFNMLSQSKKKIISLRGYGLEVVETIPLATENFNFSLPPKVELPSTFSALMAEEPQITEQIVVAEEARNETVPSFQPAKETVTAEEIIAPIVEETVVEAIVETEKLTQAEPAVQEEVIAEAPPVYVAPTPVVPTLVTTATANNQNERPAPLPVPTATPVQPPVLAANPAPAAAPKAEEKPAASPELKAEPRFTTMRMGGQVMSGQALFEG